MPQLHIESVDRSEWQTLAVRFCENNYRQSWEYGQLLAEKRKAKSDHVKILYGDEVLGVADVRIKRAPFIGGVAYISGGPLTRRGFEPDVDRLDACLAALRHRFVETEGLILRVQGTLGDRAWVERSNACFCAQGFVPAAHGSGYRTLVVDLDRPPSVIRAGLAQKWRNCLNKAERSNPAPLTSTRAEDFDRFESLFNGFICRKGFGVDLGADFYRAVQCRTLSAQIEALLLTTIEVNGVMIAGHLSSMLGDTCVYLLGATSDEALNANAAYLLQWHVIKLARERGMRWYDLGGIDPAENPGVYHFKQGLGGTEMRAPGPFELVPRALRGRLTLGIESAYRRLRRPQKVSSAGPVTQ